MLEKHVEKSTRVWETNNVWLAFLFLCICWVAVMLLIIHREDLNQRTILNLTSERAMTQAQLVSLGGADTVEREALQDRLESIEVRLAQAQEPPTFLYMIFSAFEGIFILAYWLLLFQLRREIPWLAMKVYLALIPLGFVYFFLLVTLGRYHTWSQLVDDSSTKLLTGMVALFFSLGLIAVLAQAVIQRRIRDRDQEGETL